MVWCRAKKTAGLLALINGLRVFKLCPVLFRSHYTCGEGTGECKQEA